MVLMCLKVVAFRSKSVVRRYGPYLVTQIMTYHYGAGMPPGTIALEHEDGTYYGPWQALGVVGQGKVPNAYWWIRPNIRVGTW